MTSPRPQPQSSEGVLLVEGESDEQVVLHLCNRHSSFSVEGERGSEHVRLNTSNNPSFSISIKDGDSGVLTGIRNELSPPSPQVVGIIIDADDDIAKRWDEVGERIASAELGMALLR